VAAPLPSINLEMDYKNDIFISYARHKRWSKWVDSYLKDYLSTHLFNDLGKTPVIYSDQMVEPGSDWPIILGEELGRSKVLMPVFSGAYFESEWCLHELDLMNQRREECSKARIILPIVIHDGLRIPDEIKRISTMTREDDCDFSDYCLANLGYNTQKFVEFETKIRVLAGHFYSAIQAAPAFSSHWIDQCTTRFEQVYSASCQQRKLAVSSMTLKDPPPASNPRPVMEG
jgi:hypothetical protein